MHIRSHLLPPAHPSRTDDRNYRSAFDKVSGVFGIAAVLASLVACRADAAQTNFCRAILTKQTIVLNGGVVIDSFNSLDPAQSTNGRYDPAKRQDGGDIASTSDSVRTITETGNGRVYGHVATGPTGTVVTTGNASMGSLAWVDGGNRGVQPGWYTNNLSVSIPDVQLPAVTFTTMPTTGGTVNGTNYTHVLNSGNYRRSSNFSMSGSQKMVINGKVVLYFVGSFSISGSAFVYITPGSSLTLYLAGDTQLSGGGIVNGTGFATNCAYFGLPSCVNIDNTGSSDFTGTIYAPQANVKLSGGGSAVANFVGAVVAKSATLTGNYLFHYDEGLCGPVNNIVVTAPPANQTVCVGGTAVFSVTATGTALTYQWRKGTNVLAGKTNNTLTIANVTAGDAGTYSVRIANAMGAVTNSATLTVNIPVSATPLTNLMRAIGANAVFSTVASGTGPFTYVWRKNGTVIPGQTGSSLVLMNLTTNATATYSVVVSGACGSVTNSAMLVVDECFPSVDVILIIDRSGSMNGQPWRDAKTAASNFVNNLKFGANADLAGLVSYNNNATLDQRLTNSATALRQAIGSMPAADGYTSISRGLQTAQDELASSRHNPEALPVLVLLSDGMPTLDDTPSNALAVATAAKNAGSRIFTVGLGDVDHALMAGIASRTNDYFYTTNSSQLTALFNAISTIICRPPTNIVATGPTNVTVCPGATATFSVSTTSTGLTYQWLFGTNVLAGQTNNTLVRTNVSASNAGTYCVIVSGNGVAPVTNCATLTVNQNTIVTVPPSNQVTCPNTTVLFSVTATGTALTYQWYYGTNVLVGQTSSTLVISNATSVNAGLYTVIVRGACGQFVTNSATLTVNQTTVVTAPPVNQIGVVGSNVTFAVGATGTALSYRWYFNGSIVGTNSTLTLNNLTTNRAGTYCVVVSGACGNPLTNCGTLTFQNRRPVAVNDSYATPEDTELTIQAPGVLANDSDPDGDSLTAILFAPPMHGTVTLNPNGSFTYRPVTNYNGPDSFAYHANDSKTNSNLAMVNISVTPTNDAPVARDDAYTTPSDTTLTVEAPGVLANDSDVENNPLSSVLVSNPAHGALTLNANGSFTYVPNTNYSGLDSFTYKATDGSATSGVATVTITIIPTNVVVIIPPRNQTNCPGSTATFSVTAAGTALTYQWIFGTNVLTGQTNNTLVLTNVSAINAGSYCVIVSGAAGAPVTNCATLVVNENIIITRPLNDRVVCPGTLVLLPISASGTALTYQWYHGTNILAGQISSTLVLSNVTSLNAGLYTVIVRGACGAPVTNTATLTVNQNVAITIPPVNQAGFVGSNVTFSVSATGTGLSYQWFFNGAVVGTNNTLTLNNLTTNRAGTYCVVVSGTCGAPMTNCATLNFQNRPPVANNDAYSMDEDTVLTTNAPGVLVNDNDPDGDTLSAVLVTNPAHGTVTLNPNGSFNYQPITNYNGTDTFTYRANDTKTNSNIATVSISIAPRNDAPVANNDAYTMIADTVLTTNAPGVLLNDIDVENDPLSAILPSNPAHGTLTLNPNGSFTYRPDTNYSGTDSFTYRASDGSATSGVATATITIVPVGITIVTPPRNQTNCPGSTATFSVTATGTALTYQWISGTNVLAGQTNDTLVLTNVSATSAGSYCVIVSGAASAPVTNCALLVVNQNVIVTTPPSNRIACPGATVVFNVGATGTGLTYQWYHGTNILIGQTGSALALSNVTSINAGLYTVIVRGACGAPVTNSAMLTVNQNVAITSPPMNQIGFVGSNVTFSVGATGTGLSYQWYFNGVPVPGGTNSTLPLNNLTTNRAGVYCIVVSGACGAPATNCATLIFQNRPPEANNDVYTTAEDTLLTTDAPGVLLNDTDPDGDTLNAVLVSNPSHGTVTLNANGSFTYRPNTNYNGTDTFTYRATDGIATSGPATVTITVIPVNDRPVAVNDSYVTLEDTALSITAPGVLGNDIDVDGNPLRAELLTNPSHGTVTLNTNGSFTYQPATNYNGPDSFTYRALDATTNSEPATVNITVTPVNDPPTTGIAGDQYTVLEDQTLTVPAPGVLANDSDVDGDPLTAILVSGPTNGVLALMLNGSFVYRPNTNYFGEDAFTYMANDGKTNSLPALVRITVIPVNDAPSFTGGGDQDCNESSVARTIVGWARNISAGPANESGQSLNFIVSNDNNALFSAQPTIAANGTLTYTPAANAFGVANVRVVLRDNGGTANGGVDTSGEVVFRISVNSPPTVSIISPASGAGLLYPATFSVIASANDPDGNVTNVQFLVNGVVWTNVSTAPFYFIMSNAGVGFYQFSAIVSDNCGLASTSAAVNIEVITNAVVAKGLIIFNPQVGLFEQFVVVSNRTSETWANGVRLFVYNVTNVVWNATGTNNGVPYLDITNAVPAGGSIQFIVQYHAPSERAVENVDLVAVPLPFDRTVIIPQITQLQPAGPMVDVHFRSQSGRFYAIESTEDFVRWTASPTVLRGTGSIVICPEQRTGARRFYRVRMLP